LTAELSFCFRKEGTQLLLQGIEVRGWHRQATEICFCTSQQDFEMSQGLLLFFIKTVAKAFQNLKLQLIA
jgi:hypothetical protein